VDDVELKTALNGCRRDKAKKWRERVRRYLSESFIVTRREGPPDEKANMLFAAMLYDP
jgi:hypothetical protein